MSSHEPLEISSHELIPSEADDRARRQRVTSWLANLPFGPLTESAFLELRASHSNNSPAEVATVAEERGVGTNDITAKSLDVVLSDLDYFRSMWSRGESISSAIDADMEAPALFANLRSRMVVALNTAREAVNANDREPTIALNTLYSRLYGDDEATALMDATNWEMLSPYVDGQFSDGYNPKP